MRAAFLVAAGALMGGAFLLTRDAQAATVDTLDDAPSFDGLGLDLPDVGQVDDEPAPEYSMLDTVENFFIPVGWTMDNKNLQAFLAMIRTGEGTADDGGYSRLFGGGSFDSYADHPRQMVTRWGLTSSAAGAYQILSRTWDDLKNSGHSLPDFSPANQDKAAIALIKRRGALADVLAGRFLAAIKKCNKEWASLPGSPYGQKTLSMDRALQLLAQAGGKSSDGVLA